MLGTAVAPQTNRTQTYAVFFIPTVFSVIFLETFPMSKRFQWMLLLAKENLRPLHECKEFLITLTLILMEIIYVSQIMMLFWGLTAGKTSLLYDTYSTFFEMVALVYLIFYDGTFQMANKKRRSCFLKHRHEYKWVTGKKNNNY